MNRHPFDPISFMFGALLLVTGSLVLAGDTARLLGTWLAPAVIIGLGLLLLIVAWQSSRTGDGDGSVEVA